MSIDVGDRLDKYELMERVGQGGMAVVYRGLDTSLRREVAVKVLHRHLADSQEARDRFEREAQAVAKLRHENILEIFDFSGVESDESYIVTEFIDGQTLKQFITDHDIKYPEVGAMIALQVCRALGHAHALGVLHRDVKPENIMIRKDGIVKLTDFGIAQMLDLQRMTVTGQLLGSPAYMSPEHVEGQQLDFRTDVFAVGIVLYQLITGELPFKGKNPHEILKRIAECKFLDPQVVNPMVGDELARIVKRSLAREKDDRYPDVSQMLGALESYLETSGLGDYKKELQEFFDDAIGYELELPPRLIEALATRGTENLEEGNDVRALELFNRVLTLDPEHRRVLDLLDGIGQRRRNIRLGLLFGGVAAVAAIAFGISKMIESDSGEAAVGPTADAQIVQLASPDAAEQIATVTPDAAADPATDAMAVVVVKSDARPMIVRRADSGQRRPPTVDAGTAIAPTRRLSLSVSPKNSEYRIGGGPWLPISGEKQIEIPAGKTVITARNERCCGDQRATVGADPNPDPVTLNLPFLPATLTPRCAKDGVTVRVDGSPGRLGSPTIIDLTDTMGETSVAVEFVYTDHVDSQTVKVGYKDKKVVTCN